jgi:hypothetical protein
MHAKAYTLRDLAAKAQVTDQALADDKAARAAFAANPTDGKARLNALAGVSPKAYGDEAKRQADLSRADADTRAKQIEVATKQIDMAGKAFGYVRQFPTRENAISAVNWLGQNGVLTPEHVAQHMAKIEAAAPEQIQGLADMAFRSAIDAKDQLAKISTSDIGGSVVTQSADPISGKTTTLSTLAKTQSPDNIATNNVRVSEGAKDRAAAASRLERQIAADKEKAEAKGSVEASLDNDTLDLMADQYMRGDRTVFQNVGRGAQGAANLVALRSRITQKAKAQGVTGADLAAITADYSGQLAALRTSGNISARVENAISEANELIPVALEASKKVARSGLLPFGKAGIMFDTQTNNPELKAFATANNGLVSAYAGAMARGQKPTVSDFEHARQILTEAQSQEAYEATIAQMKLEMAAASRAPQNVRKHLRGEISGQGAHGGGHGTTPNPVAPAGTPSDINDLLKKYGGGK